MDHTVLKKEKSDQDPYKIESLYVWDRKERLLLAESKLLLVIFTVMYPEKKLFFRSITAYHIQGHVLIWSSKLGSFYILIQQQSLLLILAKKQNFE